MSPKTEISLELLKQLEPHLVFQHVGQFDVLVMIFDVSATDAATLLLPGMALAPQSILPSGRHPVLLLAGEQRTVRSVAMPEYLCNLFQPLQLCMQYLEVIQAVPFVRRANGNLTYMMSDSMHLDRLLPIFLGWICAFPKELGLISRDADSFHLKTLAHDPLVDIEFKPSGPIGDISSFPNFTALRPMFELEHMGRLFSGAVPLVNDFLCTNLDLQLVSAKMQAVTIEFQRAPAYSTLLPATKTFQGIDVNPLGAFRLHTTWLLDPPQVCP